MTSEQSMTHLKSPLRYGASPMLEIYIQPASLELVLRLTLGFSWFWTNFRFSWSGKRNFNQPSLDWPSRLKIIKGVTRGLAYLYKELPTLTLPHGHLKSSNVLLDYKFEPLVADYALVPVINKDHAKQFMVAYKSPEYMQNERLTRKTDVWSLGILILELLTGR